MINRSNFIIGVVFLLLVLFTNVIDAQQYPYFSSTTNRSTTTYQSTTTYRTTSFQTTTYRSSTTYLTTSFRTTTYQSTTTQIPTANCQQCGQPMQYLAGLGSFQCNNSSCPSSPYYPRSSTTTYQSTTTYRTTTYQTSTYQSTTTQIPTANCQQCGQPMQYLAGLGSFQCNNSSCPSSPYYPRSSTTTYQSTTTYRTTTYQTTTYQSTTTEIPTANCQECGQPMQYLAGLGSFQCNNSNCPSSPYYPRSSTTTYQSTTTTIQDYRCPSCGVLLSSGYITQQTAPNGSTYWFCSNCGGGFSNLQPVDPHYTGQSTTSASTTTYIPTTTADTTTYQSTTTHNISILSSSTTTYESTTTIPTTVGTTTYKSTTTSGTTTYQSTTTLRSTTTYQSTTTQLSIISYKLGNTDTNIEPYKKPDNTIIDINTPPSKPSTPSDDDTTKKIIIKQQYNSKCTREGDPVAMASGETMQEKIDIGYKNTGIDVYIERSYKGGSSINGSFGKPWIFNYDTKVVRGYGLSDLSNIMQELAGNEQYLSELNKLKSKYEDNSEVYYRSLQELYSRYVNTIEKHNKIKKAKEEAEAAYNLIRPDMRDVVIEQPQEENIINENYQNYELMLGDVNNDKKLDIVDAMIILKYSIGMEVSNFNERAGDINRDGKINVIDSFIAIKVYMGLENLDNKNISVSVEQAIPGASSWFDIVKDNARGQIEELKYIRDSYNQSDTSTAVIGENNYTSNVDNEGYITDSTEINRIKTTYKMYKEVFLKVDKQLNDMNEAINYFDNKLSEIEAICNAGKEIDNIISNGKTEQSIILSKKYKEETLLKQNRLMNTYVEDFNIDMLNFGNNRIGLVDENGVINLYALPEPYMNSLVYYSNTNIRNFYPEGAELISDTPTKTELYILPEGGYLRVLADRTKYYYDIYGQLERVIDMNNNQVDFEYSNDTKSAYSEEISTKSGFVYLRDRNVIVENGGSIESLVYLDSGDKKLGSYNLEIKYDPSVINVDTTFGTQGAEAGIDGFLNEVITDNIAGKIRIIGIDIIGKGPGKSLHLLKIKWNTVNTGSSYIDINVESLSNESYEVIGTPQGIGGRIAVKTWQDLDITEKTRRLSKIKDQYGRITDIERDEVTGRILKVTDPKGRIVSYGYDANGIMISRTDIDGNTINQTYENGLLKRSIKPDGSYLEWVYKELNGKSVVDHLIYENGAIEYFNYYPDEGKFREDVQGYSEYIDPSGVMERIYYDDRSRTVRYEYDDGSHKDYEYDDNDNIIKFTDEEGYTVEYGYDDKNNRIWASYPNEDEDITTRSIEKWEYNGFDEPVKYIDRMGNITIYKYDAKGNLTEIEYPDGTKVQYIRNERGLVEYTIDAKGNKTKYEYSQYGYVKQILNAIGVKKMEIGDPNFWMGNIKSIDYDIVGNIVLTRDEDGFEVRYEIEDMGDTVEERVIDAYGITKSIYNNRKDKIKTIDKNGEETTYIYDQKHNVTKIIYPTGDIIEFKYDRDGIPINKLMEKIMGGVNHTKYYYDNRGRLEREEQVETGYKTEYKYMANGKLWQLIDNNGVIKEYEYTPGGNIKHITDLNTGLRQHFKYNSNGQLRSSIDERGNETIYNYNNMNRVEKVIGADGVESMMKYDANGNQEEIIKNSNKAGFEERVVFDYDELNRVKNVTDPRGVVSTKYNNRGLVEIVSGKDGKKAKYDYDAIGRVVKEYLIYKDGSGNDVEKLLQSTIYNDAAGRDVTIIDEFSGDKNRVNYKYDALGRLDIFTDQLGHKTDYDYNYMDKVDKITNEPGHVNSFIYDEIGRIKQSVNEEGETLEYRYDDAANESRVIDGEGRVYLNKYDNYGRLLEKNIGIIDEYGNENYITKSYKYKYDEYGDLVEEINEGNDRTGGIPEIYKYEYDKLGRLIAEIDWVGSIKRYVYYPDEGLAFNQTKVVDFKGNECITTIKEFGGIVVTEQPDDKKVIEYNVDGSIKRAYNNNSDYHYWYDEYGVLSRVYDSKTDVAIEFEIDRVNKITKRKLFKGYYQSDLNKMRVVEYQFDKADRLSKVIDGDGAETIYNYDEINRLDKEIRPNGIDIDYGYDRAGRVTSIKNVRRVSGEVLEGFGYIYDSAGKIRFKVDDKGKLIEYKYDEKGRIIEALYPFDSDKLYRALEECLDANRACYSYVNNVEGAEKYIYNITDPNFEELDKRTIERLLDGKEELLRSFYYQGNPDTGDKLTYVIEPGVFGAIEFGINLSISPEDQSKIEDMMSIINNSNPGFEQNQKMWREVYEYDSRSFIYKKRSGWGTIECSDVFTRDDQLKSGKYSRYGSVRMIDDFNGNLFQVKFGSDDTTALLEYNSDDRVINITSGSVEGVIGDNGKELEGTISYTYDVYGRRKSTIYNNEEKYRVYDGFGLESIGEVSKNNTLSTINEIVRDGSGILSRSELEFGTNISLIDKKYYHKDIQGSTVMKSDQSGNTVGKYSYDVFGNNYGDTFSFDGEYGYIGKPYTAATGLADFGFRDYSPQLGRFTTVDPIMDGDNWYSYCENDPVNLVDRNGLNQTPNPNLRPTQTSTPCPVGTTYWTPDWFKYSDNKYNNYEAYQKYLSRVKLGTNLYGEYNFRIDTYGKLAFHKFLYYESLPEYNKPLSFSIDNGDALENYADLHTLYLVYGDIASIREAYQREEDYQRWGAVQEDTLMFDITVGLITGATAGKLLLREIASVGFKKAVIQPMLIAGVMNFGIKTWMTLDKNNKAGNWGILNLTDDQVGDIFLTTALATLFAPFQRSISNTIKNGLRNSLTNKAAITALSGLFNVPPSVYSGAWREYFRRFIEDPSNLKSINEYIQKNITPTTLGVDFSNRLIGGLFDAFNGDNNIKDIFSKIYGGIAGNMAYYAAMDSIGQVQFIYDLLTPEDFHRLDERLKLNGQIH